MSRSAIVGLLCLAGAIAPDTVRAADFVPSGLDILPRLLGNDAFDDFDRSAVARAVEKIGFWAGDPVGVSQCASCHADAAAQWSASAHRFASFNNPYYSAAVEAFRHEKGFVASRFCAACHDPALVLSGRIDGEIDRRTREAQAGIVCLTCHSIADHPSHSGNGGFIARLAPWSPSGPEHKARLRPATLATSDFCGTCHRVGLTPEVTSVRWLRGQDDLYPFLGSSIAGAGSSAIHRAPSTQRCQDCHMPLEASSLGDAAAKAGSDGVKRIRSHRFLGANTALPHLRGDAEQEKRVEAFLRDRVSLDLLLADGGELDVVMRSRGVGHRFPSGTMDSNEVWLEVRALDAQGKLVGESGALREDGRGPPALGKEAHLVRAQMVGPDGVPLPFRDVQHARGVVYDNALNPGDPQAVRYELPKSTRRVRARLLYRKFSAEYLRFSCAQIPDEKVRHDCESAPVVEMANAEVDVPAKRAPVADRCRTLPWDQVLNHGLALAAALVDHADEADAWLQCAAEREPKRVEPALGRARLALVLGQTDEVLQQAELALSLSPDHPAAYYLSTVALLKAYRHEAARASAERLAKRLPTDPASLSLLARARGLAGDADGAIAAADELLRIDPESEDGHYQRSLALRDLKRGKEADVEEAFYVKHRAVTEENLALRVGFRRWHGQLHDESEPLHAHHLQTSSTSGTARR